jgi:hypothetical protein
MDGVAKRRNPITARAEELNPTLLGRSLVSILIDVKTLKLSLDY